MIFERDDDDDDDDDFDPITPPGRTVLLAVVTAAVTTLVTSLVTWGIDEVRAKFGSTKPEEKP